MQPAVDQLNRLAKLSPDKRELLFKALSEKAVRKLPQTISRRDQVDHLPVSYAQARLWFIDQMSGGSSTYNVPAVIQLKGPLSVVAFEHSMREVMRRHEILRTSFGVFGEEPEQVIADNVALDLTYCDLRSLAEPARGLLVRSLGRADAQRPFDLRRAPLVRATFMRLAEDLNILLLTMHHIICDGWSDGLFLNETASLYQSFSAGGPSTVPELPIQYADYAQWQRGWLTGDVLEKQLAYWRKQLADTETLELPADQARQAIHNPRSASVRSAVTRGVSQKLRELGRAEGATLFMTLTAAFSTLLARLTGQTDIVIGTPIAGRTRPETERLIGLFLNTLVVRTDLSGDPSFIELLGRVKQTTLAAHAHQDLPFEKLVEELRPERFLNRTPLFQVMLDLQTVDATQTETSGLDMSVMDVETDTAKFDILLTVSDIPEEELALTIVYNADILHRDTVERLLDRFNNLLGQVVAGPRLPVSRLSVLTQAETEQLEEWNATSREYPRTQCLHQIFQLQAQATPDAVAGVYEDRQINYRELDRRANQVAHHLTASGVLPGTLVAILVERGLEMLVGLLGVLKAGGAYVPLDPAQPKARLAYFLAATKPAVLLTQEDLLPVVPEHDAHVVCIDRDRDRIRGQRTRSPKIRVVPENLAYVIFTSGSSGVPKGVPITHGAVINVLMAVKHRLGLSAFDTLPAITTLCFDIASVEFLLPIICGGRVLILSREAASDGLKLQESLTRGNASVLQATPATWRILLDSGWSGNCELKAISTGEALLPSLAGKIRGRVAELWNLYGPTETTIWSTVYKVSDTESAIPIGCPIANTQVHLVDWQLRQIPIGVPGELLIGGDGLSQGYWNDAGQTAERFIPDFLGDTCGARLYRTGDLGRYRRDGSIEYLGRTDDQVKIRGFRIEPAEVQVALLQQAGVKEAVVVARQKGSDTALVGYVVGDRCLNVRDLRQRLKERLPEYAVPSAIVQLERLPLTTSGKVDRKALPEPMLEVAKTVDLTSAQRPVEELICDIYAALLGYERIPSDADFFELGGHSLLATQAISRINAAFHVTLTLRDLFKGRTAREVGARVEAQLKIGSRLESPMIERSSSEKVRPLSFSQQRLWFFQQTEPASSLYNIAVAARLRGPINLPALEQTLNEIVRRHDVFRTTFAEVDHEPRQVIHDSVSLPLQLTDVETCVAGQQERVMTELLAREPRRLFDLASEPSMRLRLLRRSAEDHVILRTIHHIISDGWSVELFQREVVRLYGAFSSGEPSPLPEPFFQYADFADWQRQWLASDLVEEQLRYWTGRLEGATRVLELPTDHPRPAAQTYNGGKEMFVLPLQLSNAIDQVSRREGVTKFMTLLAAWQVLLYRYTGCERISVGTPVAGRTRKELEDVMGLFINTLVLHSDLSGDPTFRELLARVREVAIGAYLHQDVPFERIVSALQAERSLQHTPIFQVFFEWTNRPMEVFELPGLKMDMLDFGRMATMFDLKMVLAESGDGLVGYIEYSSDLFSSQTIRRLLGHFQHLLESAASDPERHLSSLELLTDGESRELQEWNATQVDFPREECLQNKFEEQARQSPDAIAVSYQDRQISYSELNRRSNQLARHLLELGVGPDQVVGILMERSVELMIALLGVLKAGGAYLPIDPQYPPERAHFMLNDAQVAVLIVQKQWLERRSDSALKVFSFDVDWETAIGKRSGRNLPHQSDADNLAYVIYTSGSTGRPKGVMVPHRAITNHMHWMQSSLPLTHRDRVLQKTSISFDASIWELFLPLWAGARLHMAEAGGDRSSSYLVETVATHQITILQLVPSMLSVCLEEPGIEQCRSLRCVYSGGEALTRTLSEGFSRCLRAELHNLYGPTEASIDAMHFRWNPSDAGATTTVPIGSPISNLIAFVLDDQLQRVPVLVKGQLFLSGAGLARGYFQRPELTASSFLPNPYSEEVGARLYRTGDVVRYLPEGSIEYLGRIDDQVKIRGFRIELGEIEAALRAHPEVKDAVVVARSEAAGHKRLVAYVLIRQQDRRQNGIEGEEKLEAFLRERLPEYMIPTSFVVMQSFPLSPNGKIDRRALPAPNAVPTPGERDPALPATESQKTLARIWAEVLGIEAVGVHDDFFRLGGDSIQSLQIVSKARSAGLRFTTRQLFAHPTIAELASIAETAPTAFEGQPKETWGPTVLTPIQHRFFDMRLANPNHFNQALLLEFHRPSEARLLRQIVGHLVAHHDALRTRFVPTNTGWIAHVLKADEPDWLVFDLKNVPASEQRSAIEARAAEIQTGLNIVEGPLVRVALFDLGAQQPVRLLLAIHHLVVDAVSWRILIQDFELIYDQLTSGRDVQLPSKTTSFREWASHLEQHARLPAFRKELEYWLADGTAEAAKLPVDLSTGEQPNLANSAVCSGELDERETRALLRDVPGAYRTQIDDVLLTAVALAFHEWVGCSRIRVDVENHGREEMFPGIAVTHTVGWFTAIYPVVLEVGGHNLIRTTLQSVKEQLRRVPNHGIGYGLLHYMSGDKEIARLMQAQPRAEILFNYLGQLDHVLSKNTAFAIAKESPGPVTGTAEAQAYRFDITARIEGNCFRVDWTYNTTTYRRETVEHMVRRFLEVLKSIVADSQVFDLGTLNPADYPLARLSQKNLQRLARGRQIEDIYALSPLQTGFLFHALRSPHSQMYTVQMSFKLEAQLDVSMFRAAWQKVVERHGTLRTSFEWEKLNHPVQLVHRDVDVPWEYHDWLADTAELQAAKLAQYLASDRARGFRLASPPLMRLCLVRLDESIYQFIWTTHHLLMDGWSGPIVIRELGEIYDALTRGHEVHLPPAQRYSDYIAWLEQQDLPRAKSYWRDLLRGFKEPTRLCAQLESSGQTDAVEFHRRTRTVAAGATADLQAFAQRHRLTLNTLVQAAWAIVISRLSGKEDVLFGVIVSGRTEELAEIEAMVGVFINTLPLRVQFDPNETLLAGLQKLQAHFSEMRQYEYTPLVEIQGSSDVPGGVPLFESFLNFLNYPTAKVNADSAALPEVRILGADNFERANYPITVDISVAGELALEITADSQRLDARAVDRMLDVLALCLEEISAHAQSRYADFRKRIDEIQGARDLEKQAGLKEARRSGLRSVRRKNATPVM
jgi:amino acid adenylation domain-containing protein/non-ribosomal peptide synthase protein (TIGR01720 family)